MRDLARFWVGFRGGRPGKSPLPGSCGTGHARSQSSCRQMRLEAGNARRSDDGVMAGPGRKVESIANRQLNGLAGGRKAEPDRTPLDHDDLVVGVVVGAIPLTGSVPPCVWVEALPAKAGRQVVRHDALS